MMTVPVDSRTSLRACSPPLFRTRADGTGHLGIVGRNQYLVSADGQRFLVNQLRADVRQRRSRWSSTGWPCCLADTITAISFESGPLDVEGRRDGADEQRAKIRQSRIRRAE